MAGLDPPSAWQAAPAQPFARPPFAAPPQTLPLALGFPSVSSNSPAGGGINSPATPATPTRSVLFNTSSAAPNAGAFGPDPVNQDQVSQSLISSGLPLSKSGAPFFPPPPQLANAHDQALAAARLVAPNLIDYLTKPLPPEQPFPSAPGKIPSADYNPYAAGALLDALNFAIATASLGAEAAPFTLARMAGEAAPGTMARAAELGSAATPSLDQAALQRLNAALARQGTEPVGPIAANSAADASAAAGDQLKTGPYNTLRRQLPAGWQANHLNQDAVYRGTIPRQDGFSVGMRGNIITEPGTPTTTTIGRWSNSGINIAPGVASMVRCQRTLNTVRQRGGR